MPLARSSESFMSDLAHPLKTALIPMHSQRLNFSSSKSASCTISAITRTASPAAYTRIASFSPLTFSSRLTPESCSFGLPTLKNRLHDRHGGEGIGPTGIEREVRHSFRGLRLGEAVVHGF